MQVIRSRSFSGPSDACVPAAYNWHYVLRASPNSRTPHPPGPGTKPQKNKAKVCKLRYQPTRSKKARVYKQPVMFVYFLMVPAALAFFPRLHVGGAFFFSGFFFVEMVSLNRLDQIDCPFTR